MRIAEELREESRLYREATREEADRYLKRRLANHALALAQLAERIERQGPQDRTSGGRLPLSR
jgi:hypothetical protein